MPTHFNRFRLLNRSGTPVTDVTYAGYVTAPPMGAPLHNEAPIDSAKAPPDPQLATGHWLQHEPRPVPPYAPTPDGIFYQGVTSVRIDVTVLDAAGNPKPSGPWDVYDPEWEDAILEIDTKVSFDAAANQWQLDARVTFESGEVLKPQPHNWA